MNDKSLMGPVEYKVVQGVRDMGPSTPSAIATWIAARDVVAHGFGSLFTTMKRLAEKGHLSVRRLPGRTARGGMRDMDVYTVTPQGETAARTFQQSIQNFMLPESGE